MENLTVEQILEFLFDYYNVSSAAELSEAMNVSQKTISNWKIRNAILAVKKKCRELGIYSQIFSAENLQQAYINNGSMTMHNHAKQAFEGHNKILFDQEILNTLTIISTMTAHNESYKKDFEELLKQWVREHI